MAHKLDDHNNYGLATRVLQLEQTVCEMSKIYKCLRAQIKDELKSELCRELKNELILDFKKELVRPCHDDELAREKIAYVKAEESLLHVYKNASILAKQLTVNDCLKAREDREAFEKLIKSCTDIIKAPERVNVDANTYEIMLKQELKKLYEKPELEIVDLREQVYTEKTESGDDNSNNSNNIDDVQLEKVMSHEKVKEYIDEIHADIAFANKITPEELLAGYETMYDKFCEVAKDEVELAKQNKISLDAIYKNVDTMISETPDSADMNMIVRELNGTLYL